MKKEIQKLKKANNKYSNYKIPIIKKYDKNKVQKNYNNKNPDEIKIVVDVPLLFEAKVEKLFDRIIVVKANKKTQIGRILKKKKYSKKEIENIIKSQMPLKEKIKRADFVVDNSKTLKNTQRQIENIFKRMYVSH